MTPCPCPACRGRRLRPEALAVTVGGKSIYDASHPAGGPRRWPFLTA